MAPNAEGLRALSLAVAAGLSSSGGWITEPTCSPLTPSGRTPAMSVRPACEVADTLRGITIIVAACPRRSDSDGVDAPAIGAVPPRTGSLPGCPGAGWVWISAVGACSPRRNRTSPSKPSRGQVFCSVTTAVRLMGTDWRPVCHS